MKSTNRLLFVIILTIYLAYQCLSVQQDHQLVAMPSFENICDIKNIVTVSTSKYFTCNCFNSTTNANEFSRILCTNHELKNANIFSDYKLPTSIKEFIWNEFVFMPKIESVNVTKLDLSHNHVKAIVNNTFECVPNVIDLDLSNNRIEIIEQNAFRNLNKLRKIDLSRNRLQVLPAKLFSLVPLLEVFVLSYNNGLNASIHANYQIFEELDLNRSLRQLQINDINISDLNLNGANGLLELFVRYNHINESSCLHWPNTLQLIDLSGNSFNEMPSNFFSNFSALREVFLRRMTSLKSIEENAFANSSQLLLVDMSGSLKLTNIHPNAFGSNNSSFLERINLQNTNINTLAPELQTSFSKLNRLDLFGTPLLCDCQLRWIKSLNLDTTGRCNKPSELENILLSNLTKKQLACRSWPNLVYLLFHVFLICCLILIFLVPIWFIYVYLRPNRHMHRKIDSSSPYARITIEANHAEDNYF